MEILDAVKGLINKRYDEDSFFKINLAAITREEAQKCVDYIIRSKKETSDREKAVAFLRIYLQAESNNWNLKYPDPKNGCQPTTIYLIKFATDISIFRFSPLILEIIKERYESQSNTSNR